MSKKRDLLDKIAEVERADNEEESSSKKGRKVEVKVLRFEIDEEKDSELSIFVKKLVNEKDITNQDLYNVYGRAEGWNMIYGLRKGSISWERVKKWCEVMGYQAEITLSKITEKEQKK
jgi:hypothetical protein